MQAVVCVNESTVSCCFQQRPLHGPWRGLKGACWTCVCEDYDVPVQVWEQVYSINPWETILHTQLIKKMIFCPSPNFTGSITALISVISVSSRARVPYTNYSCQQLNVFIPFCLLYYCTFILLFSPHLFTRIKAYSDRIIPLHNKNKSQRLHTHHSHSKSTVKL